MSKNDALRKILLNRLSQIQNRNPSYSKRKFAKDLGLSVGALVEFLAGMRDFKESTIKRVSLRLPLSLEERSFLEQTPTKPNWHSMTYPQIKLLIDEKGLEEFVKCFDRFFEKCRKIEKRKKGTIRLQLGFQTITDQKL
jgi:hypothetical protein